MCFIKLKEKKKMICVIGFCCRFRSEIYIYVMITFFLSFLQESVCVCAAYASILSTYAIGCLSTRMWKIVKNL